MVIDHIGILVKSIEMGIRLWESVFGYKQQTEVVTNSIQKVRVVFLTKEGSATIKLVESINPESNLYKSAASGGGLHHICFRCDNVEKTLSELKKKGLKQLCQSQPGEAFCNHDIAFLYCQGVSIELIDTDVKAGII